MIASKRFFYYLRGINVSCRIDSDGSVLIKSWIDFFVNKCVTVMDISTVTSDESKASLIGIIQKMLVIGHL